MPLSRNDRGISRERPDATRSLKSDTNTSHTSAHDTVAHVCVIKRTGRNEIAFATAERYALENKRGVTYYRGERNSGSN
jgi:hypothetical protein